MFSLDLYTRRLLVLDLLESEVAAKIDCREKAEQFKSIHGADGAEVKVAIVEFCARGNLHSAPVSRRVGDRSQNCGLECCGAVAVACNFHSNRSKAQELARSAKGISAVGPNPLGEIAGPAC